MTVSIILVTLSESNKRDSLNYCIDSQSRFSDPYSASDGRLGIRGTQVKSSIQDIVDEVASIKKAPLWG